MDEMERWSIVVVLVCIVICSWYHPSLHSRLHRADLGTVIPLGSHTTQRYNISWVMINEEDENLSLIRNKTVTISRQALLIYLVYFLVSAQTASNNPPSPPPTVSRPWTWRKSTSTRHRTGATLAHPSPWWRQAMSPPCSRSTSAGGMPL